MMPSRVQNNTMDNYTSKKQEKNSNSLFSDTDEEMQDTEAEDTDSIQEQQNKRLESIKDAVFPEKSNTKEDTISSNENSSDEESPDEDDSPPVKRYKIVDNQSRNRRECNRNTQEDRESTPDRTNRSNITNLYYSRITLRVPMEPSADPKETVCTQFKEIIKEMQQADEKLTLIPWKKFTTEPRLPPGTDTPNSLTKLVKYLHRIYLPKKAEGTTIYPMMFIGHDIPFDDLREALQPWFSSMNYGMFYNMLQVEDAADVGWLLYSTREMDAGALADEIGDAIGHNVGLRWKNINSGTKNATGKSLVKALTIEVSAKKKHACSRELIKLYSRTIKEPQAYPNLVRLRFVKLKKDAINKAEKSKMDKLRERQKKFLEEICSQVSYDVIQLDYSSNPGITPSLRQMIMSLKLTEKEIPIFHNVDMDWRQEGFTFQFSPYLRDDAETTINTLLPLLKHYFPEVEVESNFTDDAIERCQYMQWSDEKQMILDGDMEIESANIEAKEELIGFEFSTRAKQDLQRPTQQERTHMPEDSDSVSTLRDNATLAQRTQTQPSTTRISQETDAVSTTSESTMLTNESYEKINSRLTGLTAQMQAQQQHHEHIFEKQQQQMDLLLRNLAVLAEDRAKELKEID